MKKSFRAPWDLRLMIVSFVVTLTMAGVSFGITDPFIATLIWVIILGSAFFGVYGYRVEEGKIKIKRLGWSKDIELSEITNIEDYPAGMEDASRRAGIGGIFAYVGGYKSKKQGSFTAYVTDTKRTVIVECKDKKYVLSPDNPQEFIESVKEEMP